VPEHDENGGAASDLFGAGILTKLDQDSGDFVMYGDGGDGELVPEDLWLVEGTRWAYLRYEDNKVVERRPYGNGVPKPRREDLEPPPPERGRDCWADTPYGLMTGWNTGMTLLVTGSSKSMQNAFIRLTRAIRTKREMGGLAVKPLIQLLSKEVPSPEYGSNYQVPRFPIRDWVLPNGSRVSQRSLRDELDDAVELPPRPTPEQFRARNR
jgi:hypothetical protein